MSENNEVTRKEFEEVKTKIEENNLILKETLSTLDIVMNSIKTVCVIYMCNKEDEKVLKEINKTIMLMSFAMDLHSKELKHFYLTDADKEEQENEDLDNLLNILNEMHNTEKERKEESEPSLFEWLEQNMDKFKEMENIFKDTRKPN